MSHRYKKKSFSDLKLLLKLQMRLHLSVLNLFCIFFCGHLWWRLTTFTKPQRNTNPKVNFLDHLESEWGRKPTQRECKPPVKSKIIIGVLGAIIRWLARYFSWEFGFFATIFALHRHSNYWLLPFTRHLELFGKSWENKKN